MSKVSRLPKSVPEAFRALDITVGDHAWDIDVEIVGAIYTKEAMPAAAIAATARGFGIEFETLMEGMTEEKLRELLVLKFRAGHLDALMEAVNMVPGITANFTQTGHLTGKITVTPDSTFSDIQWRYLVYLISDYKRKSFHIDIPIAVTESLPVYTAAVFAATQRVAYRCEEDDTEFLGTAVDGELLVDDEDNYLVVE